MSEDKKEIEPIVINVGPGYFSLKDKSGEVVRLPKIDNFMPRYDDNVVTYKEGNEGEEVTYYFFENKQGELEASYGVNQDGSVSYKDKKDDEIYISSEDMKKIRAGEVGNFVRDYHFEIGNVAEFTPWDSERIKAMALGGLFIGTIFTSSISGGVLGATLFACGAKLCQELKKNKEPKEIETQLVKINRNESRGM